MIMVFLHSCNLGLYPGTQLQTNLPYFIILFVKLWIQAKKYVRYFVMSARHSTVFGIKAFFVNEEQQVSLVVLYPGLKVICPREDNE